MFFKVVEKIKTFYNRYHFSRKSCSYEIMWKYLVGPGRPQMTVWRMRIACWIPKATDTHSEYVIFIPFPLQQWLHERASLLSYLHCRSCCTCFRLRVNFRNLQYIKREQARECHTILRHQGTLSSISSNSFISARNFYCVVTLCSKWIFI